MDTGSIPVWSTIKKDRSAETGIEPQGLREKRAEDVPVAHPSRSAARKAAKPPEGFPSGPVNEPHSNTLCSSAVLFMILLYLEKH